MDFGKLAYKCTFDDIIGMEDAKQIFRQAFITPEELAGKPSWKSVLLFGPSGTGKTFLASAAAAMSNWNIIILAHAKLIDKSLVEIEQYIDEAIKLQPCIILIDDIDSIPGQIGFQEFLLQSVSKVTVDNNILLVGITNSPQCCNTNLMRRFEVKIFVGLPDKIQRLGLFKKYLRECSHSLTEDDFTWLAIHSARYSADDIRITIKVASLSQIANCPSPSPVTGPGLTKELFKKIMKNRHPTTLDSDEIKFNILNRKYNNCFANN